MERASRATRLITKGLSSPRNPKRKSTNPPSETINRQSKRSGSTRENELPILGRPLNVHAFTRWKINVLGPFPMGRDGNEYLMVTIDLYAIWIEAKLVM